jgi:hypothetical protein
MSVRISRVSEGARVVIRVAGRLQSVGLAELEKEVRAVEGPFVLDLSELISADEAGIARLCELVSGPASLRGVSRYIQMLLDEEECG